MKRVRWALFGLPVCAMLACAGVKSSSSGGTGTGGPTSATGSGGAVSSGSGGSHGTGTGGSSPQPMGCAGGCTDFPASPVGPDGTPDTLPPNAAQTFSGTPAGSGGPCLLEPQDGTLLPNNWLRPRFSWT
ncbi:MAG TPA: hypothetical protein VHF26_04115, partial [Trebonia sp.]|nr:hypothetical protein [Trebonia sp.]